MVAFFENCAILIKDNTLKRRVHGMRDYREGQTERLLELPYSQSDGRPALSGFNTARQLPLRVNEWQLFYIIAIRVEPRVIRPLQIVARDFFVTIQQNSEREISQMEVLNSLENNKKENENGKF